MRRLLLILVVLFLFNSTSVAADSEYGSTTPLCDFVYSQNYDDLEPLKGDVWAFTIQKGEEDFITYEYTFLSSVSWIAGAVVYLPIEESTNPNFENGSLLYVLEECEALPHLEPPFYYLTDVENSTDIDCFYYFTINNEQNKGQGFFIEYDKETSEFSEVYPIEAELVCEYFWNVNKKEDNSGDDDDDDCFINTIK